VFFCAGQVGDLYVERGARAEHKNFVRMYAYVWRIGRHNFCMHKCKCGRKELAGRKGASGMRAMPCLLAFQFNSFSGLTRSLTTDTLNRILPPGLNCIMWPIDSVVGRVSARVQQLVCDCGTKTKDNVFVSVQVIVQYQVIVSQAYDAYYKLTDPHLQIRSYVFFSFCVREAAFLLSFCVCLRFRSYIFPSVPLSSPPFHFNSLFPLLFFLLSHSSHLGMWRTSSAPPSPKWSWTQPSRRKRSSRTPSATRCSRPWGRMGK